VREPESLSVLPQVRAPSRNDALPTARPCSAWSHEQLAGVVRYEQWSGRRERLLSASIVSWARTSTGTWGWRRTSPAGTASTSKDHPSRGDRCATVPINYSPTREGKASSSRH
jgi:hypothetical protein